LVIENLSLVIGEKRLLSAALAKEVGWRAFGAVGRQLQMTNFQLPILNQNNWRTNGVALVFLQDTGRLAFIFARVLRGNMNVVKPG